MNGGDERLDVLDAIVYGDSFDCAVTFDEVWRYARVPIDRETLRLRLREDAALRRVVVERDGLYCLRDRIDLLHHRAERIERARRLQRRAARVAAVLRRVPFVRGLALTGSAAAEDARASADVDLLVIVEPGRLASVFLVLAPLSRLLGRRLFCPNYYVRSDRLGVPPADVYLARELDQARGLAGTGAALRAANGWLHEVFPNAEVPPESDRPASPSLAQRMLETPLHGRLGDRLERLGKRVAARRLRAHYAAFGGDVPRDVVVSLERGERLRFHAGGIVASRMARYAARRAELATQLRELDRRHLAAEVSAR